MPQQKIDSNSDKKVFSKLNHLIEKHAKCLTKKEHSYLTHYQWKSSNCYVMPKINKCQEIHQERKKTIKIYIQMKAPYSWSKLSYSEIKFSWKKS